MFSERYVRKWLGAMVTGHIVEYDAAARTYALPVERAIVRCFREGGGVPYAAFGAFQRLMAEDSGQTFDARLRRMRLLNYWGLSCLVRWGTDTVPALYR